MTSSSKTAAAHQVGRSPAPSVDGPALRLPHGVGNVLCARSNDTSLTVVFRDCDLIVGVGDDGEVLFPTDVGLSLLRALDLERGVDFAGRRVLDVGCGSGLYTVAALAGGAASVTAVDISTAAVAATSANVVRNGLAVDRLHPVVADLAVLEPDQGGWDVVLCNPPHFPADPAYAVDDGIQAALVGGADGRAVYDLLLARCGDLVAPGGALVLAHSSLTGVATSATALTGKGFEVRTALIVEMDLPLRRYAAHRDRLLARLYALRRAGLARFTGLRFEVHVLIARRIEGTPDAHR